MAITTEMYRGNSGPADIVGSFQKGQSIGQMIRKGKQQEKEYENTMKARDIFANALRSPNGLESLYEPNTLGQMAEYSPEMAMGLMQRKAQQKAQQAEIERKKEENKSLMDYRNRMLGIKENELNYKIDKDKIPYGKSREFDEYKTKKYFDKSLKDVDEKNGTPQKKLSNLSAEARNKVGSMASAVRALSQMGNAMSRNIGPRYVTADTPLIGSVISDTDYTKSERVLSEVVGRLQSGGAINKEEGVRFLAMGPRPGDSSEIKQKKLKDQYKFIENKIKAFGLTVDDLKEIGFDIGGKDLIFLTGKNSPKKQTGKRSISSNGWTIKNPPITREEKIQFLME